MDKTTDAEKPLSYERIKAGTDPTIRIGINRLVDIIAKRSSEDANVIAAIDTLLRCRAELKDAPKPTEPPAKPTPQPAPPRRRKLPPKPSPVAVKI
jgi:hypothetical protein